MPPHLGRYLVASLIVHAVVLTAVRPTNTPQTRAQTLNVALTAAPEPTRPQVARAASTPAPTPAPTPQRPAAMPLLSTQAPPSTITPAPALTPASEQAATTAREPLSSGAPERTAPLAQAPGAASTVPLSGAAERAAQAPVADSVWLSKTATQLMNSNKRYPIMARRLGQQGEVVIEAVVSERGQIQNAQVLSSSGFALLDQDALNLLASIGVLPLGAHRVNGPTRILIPLRYTLD
jgi:protein TonB